MHVTTFRRHLAKAGTKDPARVHSEFNQGLHGQKRDLGQIKRGTPLFGEWVEVKSDFIIEQWHDRLPDALIDVAWGTGDLTEEISKRLGILYLSTEKTPDRKPYLTEKAKLLIARFHPLHGVIIEDVASKGTNSLSVAESVLEEGIPEVEVLNTTQRFETVPLLDENGIPYKSVFTEVLPTFTPEECRTLPEGFCKREFDLIPYNR